MNYTENRLNIFLCAFYDCSMSYDGDDVDHNFCRGGAIFYENENGCVTIIGSLFDNCKVINGDGGALFICGKEGTSGYNMLHTSIKLFNTSYCCYSNCFATTRQSYDNNNAPNSGYGPIMLTFAENTELFYCSSVNSNDNDITSYGAIFDLTSSNTRSNYINSTNGKSVYCSSIEYRNMNSGHIVFQTFVGQSGTTIISFRDLSTEVEISYINFADDVVSGGIFNIDNSILYLSNMCFLNIDFKVGSGFITGAFYDVRMINCTIDRYNEQILYNLYTENIVFYEPDDQIKETNDIKLLNLGPCNGVLTPPLIEISNSEAFSQSMQFTESQIFSKTNNFTKSKHFSESTQFTESKKFSQSNVFFDSNKFSELDQLSYSHSSFILLTFSFSMLETFTNIKTVVFSNSYYFSFSKFKCINEYNQEELCDTQIYLQKKFPYIIYSISKTFVGTIIIQEMKIAKEKISQEQLIGIVCGSVAAFFLIIGIIIIIIQRKNSLLKYSDSYESDFECETENMNNQVTNLNYQIEEQIQQLKNSNKIDEDVDWL